MLVNSCDVMCFCEVIYGSNTLSSKCYNVDPMPVCDLENILTPQDKGGLAFQCVEAEFALLWPHPSCLSKHHLQSEVYVRTSQYILDCYGSDNR
jgi:hypothetical protein